MRNRVSMEARIAERDRDLRAEGPRTPSRDSLNNVSLMGFSTAAAWPDFAQLVDDVKRRIGPGVDLQVRALTGNDQDDLRLQTAFSNQRSPALVVASAWDKAPSSDVFREFETPPYCALEDDDLIKDLPRLSALVVSLVEVFAAITAMERAERAAISRSMNAVGQRSLRATTGMKPRHTAPKDVSSSRSHPLIASTAGTRTAAPQGRMPGSCTQDWRRLLPQAAGLVAPS